MQITRSALARPLSGLLAFGLLAAQPSAQEKEPSPPAPTPSEGLTQEELEAIAAEVQVQVAELREAEFLRPVEVQVADEEELRSYMRKRIEKMYSPEELLAEEGAAKLLRLIPPETDLMEAMMRLVDSQVGGYYDPDQNAFYLMERFADTGVTRTIMAHELTHALDDQLFGIDRILASAEGNADREHAFHAVVEGSGTAIMQQWSVQQVQKGELSMKEMMEAGDMGLDELGELPEYFWKPLFASYLRGQTFLGRTESMMAVAIKPVEPDDIDAAFRSPPLSTEQVLHPEKYWDPEQRDDPREVRLDLGRLPEGWSVQSENTLGEIGLAMVATEPAERARIDPENPMSIMGVEYTSDAAEGWGGDRYALLRRGEDQLLYAVTVWDTEEDAREIHAALAALDFDVAEPEGDVVRFWVASGVEGEELEEVLGSIGHTLGSPSEG